MVRLHPAVDVLAPCSVEQVLVAVDDFSPTALEELPDRVRVFFSSESARDAASEALLGAGCRASHLEVDDENWAQRSQEGLEPVVVGRLAILPSLLYPSLSTPSHLRSAVSIIIQPSTGFGTGHHATTRYCLEALQRIPLMGATVVDVGTGSGILAIAAAMFGAAAATGIDVDEDAIRAARENLALNPAASGVRFVTADIERMESAGLDAPADVVAANLTGTLLARLAPTLVALTRPGGSLVLSGILCDERDSVAAAFTDAVAIVDERVDGEWVGLMMKKR